MSVKHEHYESGCEDCGFYNDCPIDYECPALETLNRMRKYNCLIMVHDGNFYALIDKDDME